MQQNKAQPFIGKWTVPGGMVGGHDTSIAAVASRILEGQVGKHDIKLTHVGDAYIRLAHGGKVKISTLTHVFYATTDDDLATGDFEWVSPHKVPRLTTAPAVEEIIARTFFRDPYFFEEFRIDW